MNPPKPPENGYQSRVRTNVERLYRWSGAWAAATVLMGCGPAFLWNRASGLTLLAVALDVAAGVGMILAFQKFIAELDELQRKIFLNALAIALGVGLIAGIPYTVMAAYRVIPFKADIAHLVVLQGLTFIVSLLYGMWRYR